MSAVGCSRSGPTTDRDRGSAAGRRSEQGLGCSSLASLLAHVSPPLRPCGKTILPNSGASSACSRSSLLPLRLIVSLIPHLNGGSVLPKCFPLSATASRCELACGQYLLETACGRRRTAQP